MRKLKDEGGVDIVGLRLTEPASFKGPGGVKQGSLNKLYLEGCTQRVLVAHGLNFKTVIEGQVKAAFGSKKKTKDRVKEDPFEGIPGTGKLNQDYLLALAAGLAAKRM